MPDFERGTVEANGLQFHYLATGSGPLALCVHGFPDSPWTYRHLLPELGRAGPAPRRGRVSRRRSTWSCCPMGKPPWWLVCPLMTHSGSAILIAGLGRPLREPLPLSTGSR